MPPIASYRTFFTTAIVLAGVGCLLFIGLSNDPLETPWGVYFAALGVAITAATAVIGVLGLLFCRIADDIWLLARREREEYGTELKELARQPNARDGEKPTTIAAAWSGYQPEVATKVDAITPPRVPKPPPPPPGADQKRSGLR